MARNRGRTFLRGGRQVRETIWLFFPFASNAVTASATAVQQYALNAAALALRPFTVVRTIFNWSVISDQSAASESYIGNFGLCVVSEQAAAIGITALPTPATDQGSDLWFLHKLWIGRFELTGSDVTTDQSSRDFESRAMRKVQDGEDIVGTVEAGIGGSGCVVKTVGRMLVKLH